LGQALKAQLDEAQRDAAHLDSSRTDIEQKITTAQDNLNTVKPQIVADEVTLQEVEASIKHNQEVVQKMIDTGSNLQAVMDDKWTVINQVCVSSAVY